MASRFFEIFKSGVLSGTISGPLKGCKLPAKKVQIRPFSKDSALFYQFTHLLPDRAVHENLDIEAAAEKTEEILRAGFSQALLVTEKAEYHATMLGKLKIREKSRTAASPDAKARTEGKDLAICAKFVGSAESESSEAKTLAHNRKKPRLLSENEPLNFLISLGVMGKDGKVLTKQRDKFRQINKYLELAAPFIPETAHAVRIVDFGCGKAYLTFALYHYVTKILKKPCQITGVDLKEDVIELCENLARKLDFSGLSFLAGDIADAGDLFTDGGGADMVVTLHACDTATDFALARAVKWGASSIVCVPCCQHELFNQLDSVTLSPLLRGILRERTAALVTDAARAQLLEAMGYKTEVVEFIDAEHTPKNLMLRARKLKGDTKKRRAEALATYREFAETWGVSPSLAGLLL